ncbi:MAG TPA: hypothetical protein DCL35_01170 [Candidatus Omnitrophica bacterium]|nr:hypothetical protein [Candidatus Omnitrophota bacterium]
MTTLFKSKTWIIALLLTFWLAYDVSASIVVRAVVVNPSASQKRTVPFRSFLPKEIKPENIVDSGGLDVAYDAKEGAYYVSKDFELGPKETMTIEIEMEDVWRIPQAEITFLKEEAIKIVKVLSNTDYFERANYLKNSIDSKLNQVEHSQEVQNPSPGGYISDYRENIKLMESVKADLAAAKTLVAEAKTIAPMLTWKLIIAVLVFLGILGLVFFIVWQKQIKNLSELTEDYGAPEKPRETAPHEEGERRQAKEDKKSGISDIEERLK